MTLAISFTLKLLGLFKSVITFNIKIKLPLWFPDFIIFYQSILFESGFSSYLASGELVHMDQSMEEPILA